MVTEPAQEQTRKLRWYQRFSNLLLIVFCAEVGLFLLIYPWTSKWSENLFGSIVPQWFWLWDNAYVRGGVSGLGLLNLYISMGEVLRLFRLSRSG